MRQVFVFGRAYSIEDARIEAGDVVKSLVFIYKSCNKLRGQTLYHLQGLDKASSSE